MSGFVPPTASQFILTAFAFPFPFREEIDEEKEQREYDEYLAMYMERVNTISTLYDELGPREHTLGISLHPSPIKFFCVNFALCV